MDTCGCGDDFASVFDRETAAQDRERYRRRGPDRTTRLLLDMIQSHQLDGARVLDIGGGIGVITHELLRTGAATATLVEASPAYLEAARDGLHEAGMLDRVAFVGGDFVGRAQDVGPADIVTLDRVVCCYPDADALVSASAERASSLLGLVLPRDGWPIRLALRLANVLYRLRRSPYRSFAHPNRSVDGSVRMHGLTPISERRTFFWRVVLFERRMSSETA